MKLTFWKEVFLQNFTFLVFLVETAEKYILLVHRSEVYNKIFSLLLTVLFGENSILVFFITSFKLYLNHIYKLVNKINKLRLVMINLNASECLSFLDYHTFKILVSANKTLNIF
jgi:hypothetical protein